MGKKKAIVATNHEQREAFVPMGMRPKGKRERGQVERHCYGVRVDLAAGPTMVATGMVRSAAEACVHAIKFMEDYHSLDTINPTAVDEGTVQSYREARGLPVKSKEED